MQGTMCFSLALVCLTLSHVASAPTESSSTMTTVFNAVRDDAVATNGNDVNLSDLSVSLLGVDFAASGGLLGNLSTLRLLSAQVSSDLNVTTVDILARVDSLNVSDLQFTLRALDQDVSGSLDLTVYGNILALRVNITVDASNTCHAVLDSLNFRRFAGITVSKLVVDDVLNQLLVNKVLSPVIAALVLPLKLDAEVKLQAYLTDSVPVICDYL